MHPKTNEEATRNLGGNRNQSQPNDELNTVEETPMNETRDCMDMEPELTKNQVFVLQ